MMQTHTLRQLIAVPDHVREIASPREHRVEQRNLDVLSTLRSLAMKQRFKNGNRRVHGACNIAERHGNFRWRFGRAIGHDETRLALHDQIERRAITIRSLLAETGDVAKNDVRLDRLDLFVIQTPSINRTRNEVFDEHVGALDQLMENVAPTLALKVQRHTLLARVDPCVAGTHAVNNVVPEANEIARTGTFDLDDARTHLTEQARGKGSRHALRQVHDGNARQCGAHDCSPMS